MKEFKLVAVAAVLVLMFGCQSDDFDDKNKECETPIHLGAFNLLEETIENGLIYDSYEKVLFRNENNDTLVFDIENSDVWSSHNRICFYECNTDTTITIQGEYDLVSKTLLLSKLDLEIDTEIGNLWLETSILLHLGNPELELLGDFLFIRERITQAPYTNNIMGVPLALRNYPVEIQDMEGFDHIEEVEINGINYTDVFLSNEQSDSGIIVQMTKADGIISIEESNGVKWALIGYE